jgi:hypothetical protein
MNQLGKGKIRGKERKGKWDEVKELRKESVHSLDVDATHRTLDSAREKTP